MTGGYTPLCCASPPIHMTEEEQHTDAGTYKVGTRTDGEPIRMEAMYRWRTRTDGGYVQIEDMYR
jgi:hypothetical protein